LINCKEITIELLKIRKELKRVIDKNDKNVLRVKEMLISLKNKNGFNSKNKKATFRSFLKKNKSNLSYNMNSK